LAFVAFKTYDRSKSGLSLVFLLIAIVMLGLTAILGAILPDMLDWWERIWYAVMGLLALLVGCAFLVLMWLARTMRKS
jgi:protein-S-isoprenylcysteine O-methyltransferase Ste14